MNIPNFANSLEAPLLVSQPPGKVAILVERVGKRRRATSKEFPNARAALDWCEQQRIAFIYLPAPDRSGN